MKGDREEPTCGQCLYSKRECLGYRDPLALSFRDETDNVIQRWKTGAQKNPRVQRKTKTVSVFPEEDLETNAPDTLALISVSLFRSPAKSIHINNSSTRKSSFDSTFSMQPAVDELGVSFFVSNHIRVSPDALLQGGSPYLRSVCYDAKPDDALSLSMVSENAKKPFFRHHQALGFLPSLIFNYLTNLAIHSQLSLLLIDSLELASSRSRQLLKHQEF